MNENLKLFTSIAGKSFLNWIKVVFIGLCLSVSGIITAFVIRGTSSVQDNVSGDTYLAAAPSGDLWSNLLLVVSIGLIVIYIMLANKYALQTSICLIWENKLADFIEPLVDNGFKRIFSKQPDFFKNGIDGVVTKARLLDEIRRDDNANRIQKKVLDYGLKKLSLDGIDFMIQILTFRLLFLKKSKLN
ncbi:hypothetical protein MYP_2607 [Sporocytophaga myxococcoides]|uniref:Uncharacterized protein n=1 Tax=Sporocytophaga myxococcoides TaxID=153721 RepID=A0A098LGZ0_9BACT|nr:hypothetical protein [Sporocytophaga myxococcoides]GAL85378.1 hypothetical protein MYP_2607 [Sporocytophaga myxococcoides]